MTEPPTASTETKATVLAYLDALNRHDPDAVAACVTDDFVNEHTSTLGTTVRGRAAYHERLPEFLATFVDLHYLVEDVLVDGDRAAVPYTLTATVGGNPITIRGVFRFRARHGLLAHRVDYWDGKEFERQLAAGPLHP